MPPTPNQQPVMALSAFMSYLRRSYFFFTFLRISVSFSEWLHQVGFEQRFTRQLKTAVAKFSFK
jgi:hypothetical protein